MRAVLSKEIGGPDTLVVEDAADPVATAGQVVIRVRACGVNFPDSLIIEDKYQFKPGRPFSPGGEVAGEVESLGEGVTNLKVGDRVIGSSGWGGMAERIAVDANRCIPIPDAMPFDEASAFILTYGTSWHALKERAQLKAGETLLILGAAGGVGVAAIELAKAVGARVVAAVSSEEKAAFCREHGADDAVVYPTGPFDKEGKKALAKLFKDACGEDGAHVVYDAVGGDYAEASLRAIAWEGRFLVVGFPAGIPAIPLNLALLKGCQIVGVFWGAWAARDRKAFGEGVADLLRMYGEGKVKPHVSKHYPLEQAGQAIRDLAERRAQGKIVVTMD